jgi:nitroreductase
MFVVVYDKNLGCRWYNTQTGQIGGQWGATGAASTTTGYLIRHAYLSRSGNFVLISTDWLGWYVWDLSTLNVSVCHKTPLYEMFCFESARLQACRRWPVRDRAFAPEGVARYARRGSLMTKDMAAPMILEDEQNICDHSIHPLIAGRRSSHAFTPTSVEPETLSSLMEAARWAPSSMNEQPWSFIVATKEHKSAFHRLLGCLVEFNIQWAQHAPVLLLSVAKLTFGSNGELNRHAFHDVGQAIANLTFQATVSGLVVHQIAGFDVEKARREFSIPQDYEPVAAAAIGYPADPAELSEKLRKRDASPRKRKPLSNFVFEGGWGHSANWTRTL